MYALSCDTVRALRRGLVLPDLAAHEAAEDAVYERDGLRLLEALCQLHRLVYGHTGRDVGVAEIEYLGQRAPEHGHRGARNALRPPAVSMAAHQLVQLEPVLGGQAHQRADVCQLLVAGRFRYGALLILQGRKMLGLKVFVNQCVRVLQRRGLGVNQPNGGLPCPAPGHCLSNATPETWTLTTGVPMPAMDSTAWVTASCTCCATPTTLQP